MKKKTFSANTLLEEIFNYYKNNPPKKTREPSIEHYEWEEDGQRYSSWKIDTGYSIMYTGDAGKELFDEALKKDADVR